MKHFLKLSALALGIAFLPSNPQAADAQQGDIMQRMTNTKVAEMIDEVDNTFTDKGQYSTYSFEKKVHIKHNTEKRAPVNYICIEHTNEVIRKLNQSANYFPNEALLRSFIITYLAAESIAKDPAKFTGPVPAGRQKIIPTEVSVFDIKSTGATCLTNVRYDAGQNILIGVDATKRRNGTFEIKHNRVSITALNNAFETLALSKS